MGERWLPVVGYEGLYEVSDMGRMRSVDRVIHISRHEGLADQRRRYVGIPLKTRAKFGYQIAGLWKGPERSDLRVHRLVLEAFVGPPPEGMIGCHNNGNKADNRVENLRWDTHSGNAQDVVKHGNNPYANRTHCPKGHQYSPENTRSYGPDGRYRKCRQCHRDWERKRYQRTTGAA